ncbi:MAG: hypothetical protein JXA23_06470, partial [Bacteroidales bacterium]|nr:hypothetical protein [Bacteroidales bacterium]
MKIQFIGNFTNLEETEFYPLLSDFSLTKVGNILVSVSSRREFEGEHTLVIWGNFINLHETSRLLGIKTGATPRLLDLFLTQSADKIFPLLDGNFTGILIKGDSTLIFRDKNGGGPSVYYSPHHFSSTVDGLILAQKSGFKPDLKSISFFLEHGYIPSPHTAFNGISKIPPGHSLLFRRGSFTLTNPFPFSDFIAGYPDLKISVQEAAEQYSELHRNAIKKRISGNHTVGILLSGGYDSGGNLARLREVFTGEVKSFSIGFKGNPMSELPYARQFADHYGTHHFEYEMDGHEIEYLPQIIKGFNDPFQENGLMLNISAMKLLQTHPDISTTLCGEGNDQLFGVQTRELAIHFVANRTGINLLQKGIKSLTRNKPFLADNQFYRIQFNNNRILNILHSDTFGFNRAEQTALFRDPPDIPPDPSMYDSLFQYRNFTELYLGKTYFIDIQQTINEIIAYKAARAAEVFGNTLAFPLLDREIYQFVKKLPVSYRFYGSLSEILRGKGISKYLFKTSLKGKLPEKAVSRKKQGGFAPMVIFFQDEERLQGINNYILHSDMAHQLLDSAALKEYFAKFSREINQSKSWFWYDQFQCFQLFSLLILTLWWDQFINNRVFPKLSDYTGVSVKK